MVIKLRGDVGSPLRLMMANVEDCRRFVHVRVGHRAGRAVQLSCPEFVYCGTALVGRFGTDSAYRGAGRPQRGGAATAESRLSRALEMPKGCKKIPTRGGEENIDYMVGQACVIWCLAAAYAMMPRRGGRASLRSASAGA